MSAEATAWAKVAVTRHDLKPSERRALLAIAARHRKKTGLAKLSYADMAAVTMDCQRSAKRAVQALEAAGLVIRIKQRKGERQGANAYAIALESLGGGSQGDSMSLWPECHTETPEPVTPCHPEVGRQSDMASPPNARARADKGDSLANEELSFEEMESRVWQTLRLVGGAHA